MKQTIPVGHEGVDARQANARDAARAPQPVQRRVDESLRQSAQRGQLAQLHGEPAPPRAIGPGGNEAAELRRAEVGAVPFASTAPDPVQRRRVSDGKVLGSIKADDYPESVQHISDAIGNGHPSTVTVDRSGAKKNRRKSLRGIKTISGTDRDEYPMAMFSEGGTGASVRHIDPSDNRGAGSSIGHMLRDGAPDGEVIDVEVLSKKGATTAIQLHEVTP